MKNNSGKFKISAFTLIELIIVLAIIALLVTIATSVYTGNVTKVRRSEAKVALLEVAAELEQYFMEHNTYKNASTKLLNSKQTSQGNYQLRIKNSNDSRYLIQAIPQGAQAKKDKQCGTLELNQLGEKSITGSGSIKECWG